MGGWNDGKRECIEFDADPRHEEVLLVQSGLFSAQGVTTPFEKVGVEDSTMALLEDGAVESFSDARS